MPLCWMKQRKGRLRQETERLRKHAGFSFGHLFLWLIRRSKRVRLECTAWTRCRQQVIHQRTNGAGPAGFPEGGFQLYVRDLLHSSDCVFYVRVIDRREARATCNDQQRISRKKIGRWPPAMPGESNADSGGQRLAIAATPSIHGARGARCLVGAKSLEKRQVGTYPSHPYEKAFPAASGWIVRWVPERFVGMHGEELSMGTIRNKSSFPLDATHGCLTEKLRRAVVR